MMKPNRNQSVPLSPRPPIVAVLGHIDHGKTTLLDKIRQTNVQIRETKGITQHIGASEVSLTTNNQELRTITFIDTPGHAAFSQMRSRGARVADMAVLVVAADEGFRPQTRESWDHIKKAELPCIVALNKIDLPGANLESAKESLFQNDIPLEEGGGDIPVLPVSAKTGEGIKELLEMILLVAEMNNVSGHSDAAVEAVVIESKMDKGRGPVATLVVRNGRLTLGDEICAGQVVGKIKALRGTRGEKLEIVHPGEAAEILGFKEIPDIGSQVVLVQNFSQDAGLPEINRQPESVSESSTADNQRFLNVILKADVAGTLEAIKLNLPLDVKVVGSSVGEVSEGDILLAQTMMATVLSFRVKISASVKKLAAVEKVKLENFQTIYELLDWVDLVVKKLAEPIPTEEILGRAEIIAEFVSGKAKIAGAVVREGRIAKKDRLRLERDGETLGQARIKSLKSGKKDTNLASLGTEFGVVLDSQLDFQVGDMLVSSHPLPSKNGR